MLTSSNTILTLRMHVQFALGAHWETPTASPPLNSIPGTALHSLIRLFWGVRCVCVRMYACFLTSLVTGGLGKSIRINPGCVTVKNIPSYSSRTPFVTRLSLPILYPSIDWENEGDPKASGRLSKEGTRTFFAPVSCARFCGDLIKVNKRQLLYGEDSASQVCHIDLFHCPSRASHSMHTC